MVDKTNELLYTQNIDKAKYSKSVSVIPSKKYIFKIMFPYKWFN